MRLEIVPYEYFFFVRMGRKYFGISFFTFMKKIKIFNSLYMLILLLGMADRRRFTRGHIESRE